MEDQLEDGNLYMNYRGYYGSSGFGGSEINGANNGYKTPFASLGCDDHDALVGCH